MIYENILVSPPLGESPALPSSLFSPAKVFIVSLAYYYFVCMVGKYGKTEPTTFLTILGFLQFFLKYLNHSSSSFWVWSGLKGSLNMYLYQSDPPHNPHVHKEIGRRLLWTKVWKGRLFLPHFSVPFPSFLLFPRFSAIHNERMKCAPNTREIVCVLCSKVPQLKSHLDARKQTYNST